MLHVYSFVIYEDKMQKVAILLCKQLRLGRIWSVIIKLQRLNVQIH